MIINSKSNPTIKEIIKLYDKKYRQQYGKYLVEGTKPVDECLAYDHGAELIVCTEQLAAKYDSPIVVSETLFSAISAEKTPQGVIAVVKLPDFKPKKPDGRCLLLDRIRDPGNLGTIIRTANAAGYSQLYLINCADPFSPKVVRASMSGIFFVKIYQGTEDEILDLLSGTPIICADMEGENIFDFSAPEKFCLGIGNEGGGLDGKIKDQATFKVKIPMAGTCESLNAAVSAGIAMYVLKQR